LSIGGTVSELALKRFWGRDWTVGSLSRQFSVKPNIQTSFTQISRLISHISYLTSHVSPNCLISVMIDLNRIQ
jgi:hypothetical protein